MSRHWAVTWGVDADGGYVPLADLPRPLADAIWAGDTDKLYELAPCACCCHEHTFENCDARLWGACRGQGSMTRAERQSWVDHYTRHHGMTEAQFWDWGDIDPMIRRTQLAADAEAEEENETG